MGVGKSKCDISQLKKLRDDLEQFANHDAQEFAEACAKELAARLLARVIKRTPVGDYPSGSGKKGGTLRRGWTGEKRQSAKSYVDTLTIHYNNGVYTIEIINPVEYAPYVEFGHRTRNHKGWVKGVFMLTISEQELNEVADKIVQRKLEKILKEVFK